MVMKTFLRIIGVLVVIGIIALLAFIFVPVQLTKPTKELAADWKPAEGQPYGGRRQALCRWSPDCKPDGHNLDDQHHS